MAVGLVTTKAQRRTAVVLPVLLCALVVSFLLLQAIAKVLPMRLALHQQRDEKDP